MIIIPARIGSSRFPNKVLADIGGIPMVIRTAKTVADIRYCYYCHRFTRGHRYCQKSWTFELCLTSTAHQSGTDRIYEAAQKLSLAEDEIIINVQGDEPFIETDVVQAIYDLTKKHKDNVKVLNELML